MQDPKSLFLAEGLGVFYFMIIIPSGFLPQFHILVIPGLRCLSTYFWCKTANNKHSNNERSADSAAEFSSLTLQFAFPHSPLEFIFMRYVIIEILLFLKYSRLAEFT